MITGARRQRPGSSRTAAARQGVRALGALVALATCGCKGTPDLVPWAMNSSVEVATSTAVAGGPGVAVTVTVRNRGGGLLRDVVVKLSSSGTTNEWSPPARAVTGRDGKATATLRSSTAEVKSIAASVGGFRLPATPQVTFVAGPPVAAHCSLEVTPANVPANGVAAVTITANIRDAFDNPVGGEEVTFAASGDANLWSAPSATSGPDGRASVRLSSTVPQTKQVTAAAGGVTLGAAAPVHFLTPSGDLLLTELGATYYVDVPAWVEVFNPTAAAVDLGAYELRASSIAPGGGTLGATTFTLPHVTLAAGAFAVIAGKTWSGQIDGGGLVHVVAAGGVVPYWTSSGHVELTRNGATVDFVRFGTDASSPITSAAWTGGDAEALPGSVPDLRVALARSPDAADLDGPAEWAVVPFATPGGVNDVEPDAVDSDADGIPDAAKQPGGTFAGLDLYAMGARAGQRDLFIELDAMDSTDPCVTPHRTAVEQMVARFAAQGIAVHVDAGTRFSTTFDAAAFNLGQAVATVPSAVCVGFDVHGCRSVEEYKTTYLELARRSIFVYALFGTSQNADGSSGNSGVATLPGTELLVTLGAWGLDLSSGTQRNLLENTQAATLMHELGHNLGLGHGGFEDRNYKPNYLSAMNYLYTSTGIPDPSLATAGDPYRYEWYSVGTICEFAHGPCGSPEDFALDFSHGGGLALDERAVLEADGLGRHGAWVDFDADGSLDTVGYGLDLNHDGALDMLNDSDDWSAIVLPYGRGEVPWYGLGPEPTRLTTADRPELRASPFAAHLRRRIVETAPSPERLAELRRAGATR